MGAGLTRLYHALLEAPWLRVEEIEISGLEKLDRFEVLNTMGVRRGESVLNLRMKPIVERIKTLPSIKTASVRLDSPGRIVAEIKEREPIALLRCGESTWLIDDEGILFAKAPDENLPLPIVSGLCGLDPQEGGAVPARGMREIRELMAALDRSRSWLSPTSVRECQWNAGGFTLVLGERGVPVDIGQDDFDKKLAKLRKVISTLNERQWNELVTRIDLDYPGKAYLDGQFPIPKSVQGGHGKQSG